VFVLIVGVQVFVKIRG